MINQNGISKVLVTGGAGYVGAVLVPRLLHAGYSVNVLDLLMYGDEVFGAAASNDALSVIKGDIRDPEAVQEAVAGQCQQAQRRSRASERGPPSDRAAEAHPRGKGAS